jgi:hypothetical protein
VPMVTTLQPVLQASDKRSKTMPSSDFYKRDVPAELEVFRKIYDEPDGLTYVGLRGGGFVLVSCGCVWLSLTCLLCRSGY